MSALHIDIAPLRNGCYIAITASRSRRRHCPRATTHAAKFIHARRCRATRVFLPLVPFPHPSPGSTMDLATLPDCRAGTAPHAAAVADDNTDLNNTAFLTAVRRATTSLRAAGVSTGDVVAIMLPNTAALVVSLFATWRLGATATLIDPASPTEDACHRMAYTGAEVLIAVRQRADAFPVRTVIPVDTLTTAPPDTHGPARARDDAPALLIHTNHAGGDPEIVTLDHLNLNALCRLAIEIFALTDTDHSLSILPLFHLNGIAVGTVSPLLAGGRTTVVGPFSPTTFFDRIEGSRATYFTADPTMYTQLSDLPAEIQPNTTSVRLAICGAARAGDELRTKFEHRYGIPIIQDHGLTEVPGRARFIRPIGPLNRSC
ncbi:class I adenylate-forming enzyme family protein [Nocardia amikacinitolerans]|uniref:class I adenylate-forming enzyme family protein n=1 Tax=Nocardia amikacinitolerans TaxID=756689 RepID=UPI0020A3DA83|nr:class I adenylate-forming enzyme family protein [Nocardia amikacinitolerans]